MLGNAEFKASPEMLVELIENAGAAEALPPLASYAITVTETDETNALPGTFEQ